MARELDWSADRVRDEVSAVARFYDLGRLTSPTV
jgi:hypothetical protein